MAEKILLVDDDSNILDGYRRSLGREFLMETAQGGEPALALAAKNGPYAVVVSDMRMPGMDGIQLLSRIKALAPDTIRVMLTGNADMETAINAINEGSIFRFLNKPCSKEAMAKTLTAALVQYRLVTAEKQLLEQTLSGSLQVLTEVLSLVNPAAFSRAERARRYIHHIVTAMKLGNPWQYEVAAMLSQLGCVTLAPETIEAVYSGQKLSANEQLQYDAHPNVAYALLSKIPRLEPIAWMIQHQNQPAAEAGATEMADMRLGAEILRLVLAYEQAIHKGSSRTEAAHLLARQNTNFSPQFFQALVTLDPNAEEGETRKCRIEELAPGMIIQEEVRTLEGALLVSKGQEVTSAVIFKLKNFHAQLPDHHLRARPGWHCAPRFRWKRSRPKLCPGRAAILQTVIQGNRNLTHVCAQVLPRICFFFQAGRGRRCSLRPSFERSSPHSSATREPALPDDSHAATKQRSFKTALKSNPGTPMMKAVLCP